MLHVVFNMLMVVLNVTSMLHAIVVSHVLGNMLVMMDVTTISVVTTMFFHVVLYMLVVVFNVPAVFHAVNMGMLFRMGVLNMMQLGFTVMLSSTAM